MMKSDPRAAPVSRRSVDSRRIGRRAFALCAAVAAVLVAWRAPAFALGPDQSAEAWRQVRDYCAAESDSARQLAIERLEALKVTPKDLRALLAEPPLPAKVQTGRFTVRLPGSETETFVYIPDDYSPKKRWRVLIALHGMGGDGRQIIEPAGPIAEKRGYLVVAPSLEKAKSSPAGLIGGALGGLNGNNVNAVDDAFGWGDQPDNYALKALDYLKENYRIDENRTVLLGVSMGGYGTWYVGCAFPTPWAAMLPYAGGIALTENHPLFGRNEPRRGLLANLENTPVYFVHGAKDSTVMPFGDRESAKDLKKLGYQHEYQEEAAWDHIPPKTEVPLLIDRLLGWAEKKTRTPWPKSVTYHSLSQRHRGAFWLQVLDGEDRGSTKASVQDQRITVAGRGVKKYRLFLHPDLCSLKKAITVTINDAQALAVKPEESLDAALESWRLHRDPSLIAHAMIDVAAP